MPKYVIERQYLLSVYQRLVEANSVAEACCKAIDHDDWGDAVEDNDGARETTISAIKRISDDIDPAELDFDPDDRATQYTSSLGGFLYGGDTATIHSDVPEEFTERADT